MLTVEYLHHTLGLFDLVIVRTVRILARGERLSLDVVLAFHHQLQHESAHLSRMSIFCRIVVSERDVICSLQHTQEVVGEDRNLVVDGGQAIRLADGIRDERCVAHSLRDVAFIARQYKDVLEVEVSSFEYTHDLDAFGWLAMERNRGGLEELQYQTLQGDDVHDQVARGDQTSQTVDERIGAEQGFLEQWFLLFLSSGTDALEYRHEIISQC